jgi:hypothetical protein
VVGKSVTLFDDVSTTISTPNLNLIEKVIVKVLVGPGFTKSYYKYTKSFQISQKDALRKVEEIIRQK